MGKYRVRNGTEPRESASGLGQRHYFQRKNGLGGGEKSKGIIQAADVLTDSATNVLPRSLICRVYEFAHVPQDHRAN
jgi:hypothetical protein